MSENLAAAGSGEASDHRAATPAPELVEKVIGDALVYFRVDARRRVVVPDADVRPVAAIDTNVFEAAAKVLRESVRAIGSQVKAMGQELAPSELTVELGFTFEAKGKTTIVPVLLTGEVSGEAALKITAKWQPGATKSPADS
jgi:hypothetical protein